MITFNRCTLQAAALHYIGNGLTDEDLQVSAQPFAPDADTEALLWQHIEKAFTTPDFQKFTGDSPVWPLANTFFADVENTFLEISQHLAEALHRRSQKPGIKSGELLVLHLRNVSLQEEVADALVLFKTDVRHPFLFSDARENHLSLHSYRGISPGKIDKAALIINHEAQEGYHVLAQDNRGSGNVALFWKEEFLGLSPRPTAYHHTAQFIEATRNFINNNLGEEETELERMDKIALLQKSADFMEEHDTVDSEEFGLQVFEDAAVADRFRAYTAQPEGGEEAPQNFDLSSEAVKKHRGLFKSILKLDKNFHVYIHGNRQMIEQGEETDGRKFYKLYYEEET